MKILPIKCNKGIPQIQADLFRREIQHPPASIRGNMTAAQNQIRYLVKVFFRRAKPPSWLTALTSVPLAQPAGFIHAGHPLPPSNSVITNI